MNHLARRARARYRRIPRAWLWLAAFAGVLLILQLLAGCGSGTYHSTMTGVPGVPAAKASGKAIASAIARGQAAQQAEGIARACLRKGGTVLAIVHCAAPPHHKAAFIKCAEQAIAADIPGQETRFYTVDLEGCMVKNR